MTIRVLLCIVALAVPGFAQERQPQFDTASVKVFDPQGSAPMGQRGGPGTSDPGRITFGRTPLMPLLTKAYGVQADQISGPAWMSDFMGPNLYSITATMPPDTTNEQFQLMLQNLLVGRFQMKLHHETRNFPGYDLVVAPGGPKLKETAQGSATGEPTAPAMPKFKPDGSFNFPPGPQTAMKEGKGTLRAQYQARNMSNFAAQLGNMVSRALGSDPNVAQPRIADKTGLTGKYDFTVEFDCQGCQGLSAAMFANLPLLAGRGGDGGPAPQSATDPGSGLPNIFTALEQQLGLKLVKVKDVPLDVIIIDHAEKVPTGN
jgi:uncharacterized protein (TIGR03435 family)